MRVIVVGATGMLGCALVNAFSALGHDVLETSRRSTLPVDLENAQSICDMYDRVGAFDALAVATGASPMGHLTELRLDAFQAGMKNKFLGQVDLVLQGLARINDGGSFTLVSGATSHDPIKNGSILGAVNGAVDAFVRGAGLDLPRGLRINSVNAPLFTEAVPAYEQQFPGWASVSTAAVAQAFVKSALGVETGKNFYVR